MKYILAIDSFKECLTSEEANEAMKQGILSVDDQAEVVALRVSDGGEGFLEAMQPDETITCLANDAMMRPIEATYGRKGDTAIIEVARIVGLSMIEPELRNPLVATSYGVGEVMVHALAHGCKRIVVGLGGTATSDCGLGMLRALKDAEMRRRRLSTTGPWDTQVLSHIKVTLATDVKAPLLGPQGAAKVFAPQKGASPEAVELLERRASTLASMAARHQGRDMSKQPGAGAAGGLGYAFMEFMDAEVRPGADVVLDSIGFDRLAKDADIVVTGEGHADSQTLMGKLPKVVLDRAKKLGVPVVLVAGKLEEADRLLAEGFGKVLDINESATDGRDALDPEVATDRLKAIAKRLV
jgi:glycerate kinase